MGCGSITLTYNSGIGMPRIPWPHTRAPTSRFHTIVIVLFIVFVEFIYYRFLDSLEVWYCLVCFIRRTKECEIQCIDAKRMVASHLELLCLDDSGHGF